MTCIVGIAESGRVWLGGDSAGSSLESGEIYRLDNAKVFTAGPYVLGFTTSYRLGQILRWGTEFPDPPGDGLERFMSTDFIAAVRKSFALHGFEQGLGPQGSILVGVRGRLFGIVNSFGVVSVAKRYAAVGSGRQVAYGALYATERSDDPPRERITLALEAAQEFNAGVRAPFVFVEQGAREGVQS